MVLDLRLTNEDCGCRETTFSFYFAHNYQSHGYLLPPPSKKIRHKLLNSPKFDGLKVLLPLSFPRPANPPLNF
jgi:hypothetical protein